jgi:hypothetical protein
MRREEQKLKSRPKKRAAFLLSEFIGGYPGSADNTQWPSGVETSKILRGSASNNERQLVKFWRRSTYGTSVTSVRGNSGSFAFGAVFDIFG